MAQSTPTASLGFQDFFSTTLDGAITDTDTTISLANAPTPTEGFLVIEPDSSTNREIIMYTSVSGNDVVCGSVDDRGIGGTTARAHSSGAIVKMNTVSDMFEALQNMTAISGKVGQQQIIAGMPVQMVSTSSSAVATGSTQIPLDDTIPQNTEGDEYMTLAITPKSTTNILVIEVTALLSNATADRYVNGALFQDTTADALAATAKYGSATGAATSQIISLTHRMVAGTTSATTFKFRAGANSTGTTTFNGRSGARLFGAIPKSSIVITEYKAA